MSRREQYFEGEGDDVDSVRLSQAGIDRIMEWCRFQLQLTEMEYGDTLPDEIDLQTEAAMLMAFAIVELKVIRQEIFGEGVE